MKDPDALPAALAAALAAHGVAPGPGGIDVATLEAAAAARGLTASVEEVAGAAAHSSRRVRHRARVWRAEEQAWAGAWAVGHREASGRGRTEAEALARALVRWLEREAGTAGGGAGTLGEAIRARRREMGLTQEAVAARCGLHRADVSRLEAGQVRRPGRERLACLADALGLPPEGLLELAGRGGAGAAFDRRGEGEG